MWVGKLAYLTADPMTIQEGRWAIAQAVTDCQVKARGPEHPHVNLPAQQPFWLTPKRLPSEGCLWGWWFQLSTITSSAPKRPRMQ